MHSALVVKNRVANRNFMQHSKYSTILFDETCVYVYVYMHCIKNEKKYLNMNKKVGMLLPKKELLVYNTSGVGKSNNYYEDI